MQLPAHGGRCLTFNHTQTRSENGNQAHCLGRDLGSGILKAEGSFVLGQRVRMNTNQHYGPEKPVGAKLTLPPETGVKHSARASQPRIVVISCTKALTSLELELLERRRLSLPWMHGWVEMRTLEGRFGVAMVGFLCVR